MTAKNRTIEVVFISENKILLALFNNLLVSQTNMMLADLSQISNISLKICSFTI